MDEPVYPITGHSMTEAEYQHFVEQAYEGKALVGVDRVFARKLYCEVPIARIRDLTGETPYFEKVVVWFALLGGASSVLASSILAGIAFRWWAFPVVPVCLVVWLSYKSRSCLSGARMGFISFALASAVGAHLANLMPSRLIGLFVLLFVFALWCERLVYCATTFFLRAFVLRNFKAFIAFNDGLRLVPSESGR